MQKKKKMPEIADIKHLYSWDKKFQKLPFNFK